MEEYTLLRQFADSWMLLLLFAFFVGIVIWVFRPGASKEYKDTASIPFRHQDKPAESKEARK
ncbi:cytochrome c oxidase cbb3-type subunit 4 [Ruegeria halocynthiae]|uniref:Cytochrome c oxidase cbb3-type subunit 4 n=1 Tax=Ruegeria halocynthiae TaxID=985054 RepID=A0A1H3C6U9_9RHOB|nr:CcoQ/FixQ family Cbb3-type cytochrome c oxidase assembly chaperone [Ruegeria halocynthiae]SDX49770.1 cytochrome c oxidase cbb3-type subunit 4 [Ruegeria halocynthiae]